MLVISVPRLQRDTAPTNQRARRALRTQEGSVNATARSARSEGETRRIFPPLPFLLRRTAACFFVALLKAHRLFICSARRELCRLLQPHRHVRTTGKGADAHRGQ